MSLRTTALAIGALATLAACNSDSPAPTETATQTSGPISFAKGGKHVRVVTESDVTRQAEDTPPTDNWVLYLRPAGMGTFRVGSGDPPEGDGSLEFVTAASNDKVTLFNFDYHESPIADFTALGYHTYQSAAAVPVQLPSINVTIDYNGPAVAGGFATLVFEPVYNPAQGLIMTGEWQDWDAIYGGNAIWWSTRNLVDPNGGIGAVCQTVCYVTWDAILAAVPHATILGGIGLNQGSGSVALTASVDAFLVGVGSKHATTYDFEACDENKHGRDKCKAKGDKGGRDEERNDEN